MSRVVERAKAALDGVTEGPWRWDGDSFLDETPHTCPHGTQWCDHGPDLERDVPEGTEFDEANNVITSNGYDASGLEIKAADAQFIAAARTLVPELVAEVERLRPFSRCPGCGSFDTSVVLHEESQSIACHDCGYGT